MRKGILVITTVIVITTVFVIITMTNVSAAKIPIVAPTITTSHVFTPEMEAKVKDLSDQFRIQYPKLVKSFLEKKISQDEMTGLYQSLRGDNQKMKSLIEGFERGKTDLTVLKKTVAAIAPKSTEDTCWDMCQAYAQGYYWGCVLNGGDEFSCYIGKVIQYCWCASGNQCQGPNPAGSPCF